MVTERRNLHWTTKWL